MTRNIPEADWKIGFRSQAAALGIILIVLYTASLYVVNRVAGTRVGGLFG